MSSEIFRFKAINRLLYDVRRSHLGYVTGDRHGRPNVTGESHPPVQSGRHVQSAVHAELRCSLEVDVSAGGRIYRLLNDAAQRPGDRIDCHASDEPVIAGFEYFRPHGFPTTTTPATENRRIDRFVRSTRAAGERDRKLLFNYYFTAPPSSNGTTTAIRSRNSP